MPSPATIPLWVSLPFKPISRMPTSSLSFCRRSTPLHHECRLPWCWPHLTRSKAFDATDVTITPANSSVPTTNESNGQILHWLVNYATLKNESSSWPSFPSLNVSTACGVVVTEYVPPQPIVGSGPHRYVILLIPNLPRSHLPRT
jgi:Phosphatidylethanolamine-binding protein